MQKPSSSGGLEKGACRSLCPAATSRIVYPFPLLQRAHCTAKLFCWLLSMNKTILCWEGGGEKQCKLNCWCKNLSPLFLLQKAVRTALALLGEWADSPNKASHKTDLAFQGQTKRKIAGTLLKQWEISFVGLQAKWRLTRDYNFNSFFYFSGCFTGLAKSFK